MLFVIVIFTASEYTWKQKRIQFTGDTLFQTYLIQLLQKWIFQRKLEKKTGPVGPKQTKILCYQATMSQILCKAENQDKSGNVGKEIGKGEITSGCIKGGSADVQGGHYWSLDISLWMKPIACFL